MNYPVTANEPKVHPVVKESFLFVPSSGMRHAPELLILELMREVFEENIFSPSGQAHELKPQDENRDEDRINATLHALRNSRRQTKNHDIKNFFAPAYPQLAARGWFRKKEARVIYNFLLSGPIAQYLSPWSEKNQDIQVDLVRKIIDALAGKNTPLRSSGALDILAAMLQPESFSQPDQSELEKNLRQKTAVHERCIDALGADELASRIADDLEAICDIEAMLPRMQWLQLVMTFLRFALPMWLLSHMRMTSYVHAWLLAAVDKGIEPSIEDMKSALAGRNRCLLQPRMTATREIFEHIETYMKRRIEINILLYYLEQVDNKVLSEKHLTVLNRGEKRITLEDLIAFAKSTSKQVRDHEDFRNSPNCVDIQTFLTRQGEKHSAWREPFRAGQGKNLDEFFRVLYRAEEGDENGGHLLISQGKSTSRGFRVFPGQMLLKTITYLASRSRASQDQGIGYGKLALQDIEQHFAEYGIDFTNAADARPLLMRELQSMGLLTGSPDAGSSVSVASPYSRL